MIYPFLKNRSFDFSYQNVGKNPHHHFFVRVNPVLRLIAHKNWYNFCCFLKKLNFSMLGKTQ